MTGITNDRDDQDQSEVFDETHIDGEGDGDLMLEEAGPVLDVTRAPGDGYADDTRGRVERVDPETRGETDATVDAANVLLEGSGSPEDAGASQGEVELVYKGLMRDAQGAQASAAHWEARRLADDDIAELGYGPDSTDTDQSPKGDRS
tara:strand:- start:1061 stop:1504 length:444 start_codon:yes stop_codon:yes gene_type:complete